MNLLIRKPSLEIVGSDILSDRWFTFGEFGKIHIRIGQNIYEVVDKGLKCITHTEPIYKHYYTNLRYLEIEDLHLQ